MLPGCLATVDHQAMLVELTNEERAARIRELIGSLPIQKTVLAEKFGVTDQAITGWEVTGRINRTNLARLAAEGGKPTEYLLYHDWERAARDADDFFEIKASSQRASMGGGVEAEEYAESHKLKFRADSLARKRLNASNLKVYYGRGDSMEPTLQDGDAIMYDTSDTTPDDDSIFVIWHENRLFVKRLRLIDDITLITSDNPIGKWRQQIRVRPGDDFQIEGKVKWIARWVQC